jgi:hypothetical protein
VVFFFSDANKTRQELSPQNYEIPPSVEKMLQTLVVKKGRLMNTNNEERELYLGWLAAVELLTRLKDKVPVSCKDDINAAIEEFEIHTDQEFTSFEGQPRLKSRV